MKFKILIYVTDEIYKQRVKLTFSAFQVSVYEFTNVTDTLVIIRIHSITVNRI